LLADIRPPWDGIVEPFLRYLRDAREVNIYDFADAGDVPAERFFTGCVAIPRAALGGLRFDEGYVAYGMEDIDFGVELLGRGARMAFVPEARVTHDYHPDFRSFLAKRRQAGRSLGYFLEKKPWRRHNFEFVGFFDKYGWAVKLLLAAARPLAILAEKRERLRCRPGPLGRFLYYWYKSKVRMEMHRGLCEYRAAAGNPQPATQEIKPRRQAA
ncbi:MAG TPA: hypothetical protein VNC50_15490, partial [Planctomycetia bacterium]|nr:hypothetical protein [Planctomycetia bacterium]